MPYFNNPPWFLSRMSDILEAFTEDKNVTVTKYNDLKQKNKKVKTAVG